MSAAEHLREAIDVGCTRDDHDHIADHRAEVLNEAADAVAENLRDTPEYGQYIADLLRQMADARKDTPEGETTQPANPDECTCMPHRKFRCGHCEMDLCQDCGQCCGCDCAKGGE
jgi:hypothetical protein